MINHGKLYVISDTNISIQNKRKLINFIRDTITESKYVTEVGS